jgi:hypothetical protein
MIDQHQEILAKLAGLRKMVDEATLGPWRSAESKDTWTLHGEAREFKGKIKGGVGPSMQILKAPKHGTPYAEYWPNPVDSALIVEAVNRFSFWLDWAEDVAARHFPTVCGCSTDHLLCAPHRVYQWDQCPEVKALFRAIEMTHGL